MAGLSEFEAKLREAVGRLDARAIAALAAQDPASARRALSPTRLAAFSLDPGRSLWRLRRIGSTAQAERHGRHWAQALDALSEAGFDPSPAMEGDWIDQLLSEGSSLAQIEWCADHGVFGRASLSRGEPFFIGQRWAGGLASSFAGDGPAEHAALAKLARAGVAGGPDRCLSPTDFAVLGLWGCAELLASMGFAPGPCHAGEPGVSWGLDPVPAILACFSPRGSARERSRKRVPQPSQSAQGAEAARMLADLERLLAMGAKLDLPRQALPEANPFLALLGGGGALHSCANFDNERGPTIPMLHALGAKLLALGADPSAGGWAAARLAGMEAHNCDWSCGHDMDALWKWAMSIGIDFGRFPAKALAQACSRKEGDALRISRKLAAAGCDPKSVSRTDPDPPIRRALARSHFGLAWELVGMGAPLDYAGADGEGALHELAPCADKKKIAFLAKALARPEMSKMLSAGSSEPGREGEQPLHRACAALAMEPMRLLLDAGADPNARDAKGWTPIRHLLRKFGAGAQANAEPCLRLLLSRGADPSIPDALGRTPAQARAGKAPMAALDELLCLRPQDLAGDSLGASSAKAALRGRGAHGRSLAEKAELSAPRGVLAEPAARKASGKNRL